MEKMERMRNFTNGNSTDEKCYKWKEEESKYQMDSIVIEIKMQLNFHHHWAYCVDSISVV